MSRDLNREEKALLGVWDLQTFEITDPSGKTTPWAREVTGKLLYSEGGYVSVSINGSIESAQPTLEEVFDSLLFYCATFEVSPEGLLIHRVCNASDRNRVGRVMERTYSIQGDEFEVISRGAYGVARNVWRRVQ